METGSQYGTYHQNFVQIPFAYLRSVISYKASEHSISIIEKEESYTSKASFLDNDEIPVYKEGDDTKYTFSGNRKPTHYKGMYKKGGMVCISLLMERSLTQT